uniref:FAD-binding FR-type domain-containing protein n=1 Tax=Pyrodinium bahamense TaxID=73915 RepID=A0A7R9ZZV6_9DINO|mmetsp:Transcript_17211/g.47474  ORF Transcript_17211/g.47474 Transcript_17211/m.47474 type:complete len:625 (+) Transcript_17211:54-1928(+)
MRRTMSQLMANASLIPGQDKLGVFHAGELYVQNRVGSAGSAAGLGADMISPRIDPRAAGIFEVCPHLFVASVQQLDDGSMKVWASALFGKPGFASVHQDFRHLEIETRIAAGDPLAGNIGVGAPLASLAISFEHRARYRINGRVVAATQDSVMLESLEAFPNCPKYIAARSWTVLAESPRAFEAAASPMKPRLEGKAMALMRAADTFFLATSHLERGADLSHRGGKPGFVRVSEDGSEVFWADYAGNGMFQSLGNIVSSGIAGVLFVDWASGSTLQISGKALVEWRDAGETKLDDSTRIVRLFVESCIWTQRQLPIKYYLPSDGASPFNVLLSGEGASDSEESLVTAQLVAMKPESASAKSFWFMPEGDAELLSRLANHRPGEYVTFELEISEKRVVRTWTISSAPASISGSEGLFSITVKREDSGLASRYLHDKVEVGQSFRVIGVGGGAAMSLFQKWNLPAVQKRDVAELLNGTTKHVLFLAGGIGITPMMSNLRALHLLISSSGSAAFDLPKIYMVLATRDLNAAPFVEDLLLLRKLGLLAGLCLAVSGTVSPASGLPASAGEVDLHSGHLTLEMLKRVIPEDGELSVYLCGPTGLMKASELMLADLQIPSGQIHSESFAF